MKKFHFIKDHFIAGLLVILPFAVIAWVIRIALKSIWNFFSFLPMTIFPNHSVELKTFLSILVVILIGVGISILGWLSKLYLGQKIIQFLGKLIKKIPLISSVFNTLEQLSQALAVGGGQFNRVVYVEYPRKGMLALAFVTGPAKGKVIPPHHLNIFIPTTPNPTSGFHFIVHENEVKESHMKVEEAFRTIVSLGLAQPENSSENTEKDVNPLI